MSNLYVMEAANLFCGDHNPAASNHLTITNFKLPGLEENYADHAAGGAPVAIEIDTHLQRLESSFNLTGWSPNVMKLIGAWQRERQSFTGYGVIRDRRTGKAMEAKAIMQGRLGRVNPQEFNRGSVQQHEYSIRGLVHYELLLEGQHIFNWDFFTNTRMVGDEDLNADINRILRIPASV